MLALMNTCWQISSPGKNGVEERDAGEIRSQKDCTRKVRVGEDGLKVQKRLRSAPRDIGDGVGPSSPVLFQR
jgi:hypothetical protein